MGARSEEGYGDWPGYDMAFGIVQIGMKFDELWMWL